MDYNKSVINKINKYNKQISIQI